MSLRKFAYQEEAVWLLGEVDRRRLGRAEWARRHGIGPSIPNLRRVNWGHKGSVPAGLRLVDLVPRP